MGEWLIVKARNATGERRIPPDKWFINQYTPLGDDADIYERKPFWGRRIIPRDSILRRELVDSFARRCDGILHRARDKIGD